MPPTQREAAARVPLGEEQAGDLYFFGASSTGITHVGFVVSASRMLHAPEDGAEPGGGAVVEEPMPASLEKKLVASGRFLA